MRFPRTLRLLSLVLTCTTGLVLAQAPPRVQPEVPAAASPLPATSPEAVGFSSTRLQRLDQAMRGAIDAKELAGAVTAVARHGKLVNFNA